jgi:hypothetical protein
VTARFVEDPHLPTLAFPAEIVVESGSGSGDG